MDLECDAERFVDVIESIEKDIHETQIDKIKVKEAIDKRIALFIKHYPLDIIVKLLKDLKEELGLK